MKKVIFFIAFSFMAFVLKAQITEKLVADYENNIPSDFSAADKSIVDNPHSEAANNSAKVLQFDKAATTYSLYGIDVATSLSEDLPLADISKVEMLIYGDVTSMFVKMTESDGDTDHDILWKNNYDLSGWSKISIDVNISDVTTHKNNN